MAPTVGRCRVHPFHVMRRAAVIGAIDFARRQRHPAHGGAANLHRNTPPAAPHPAHQRRRVDRPRHIGPRHPAPAATPAHPAAVMERRKAPRRLVDPCPTPGPHPGPAAVAVGRPVGLHDQRLPQRAVFGVLFPAAMAVEILGAGHLGRDIPRRRCALFALVFAVHPLAEAITRHGDVRAAQQRSGATPLAVELHALAGTDAQTVGIGQTQLAPPTAGQRGVVVAVEAVVPGALRQQARFVGDDFRFFGNLT